MLRDHLPAASNTELPKAKSIPTAEAALNGTTVQKLLAA
jgi:hypothetical protein